MPYEFFHKRFPELAEKEIRRMILCPGTNVGTDDDLPAGDYHLVEMFCNDPGCDCRRVMFYVITPDTPPSEPLAVIAYGWESEEFYAKWLGFDDPKVLAELKGPVLNLGSPQSRYAGELLDLVNAIPLRDANYVERLKRHYRMFRDAVDGETAGRGKVGRGKTDWGSVDRQSATFQRERNQRKREFAATKHRRKKKRA